MERNGGARERDDNWGSVMRKMVQQVIMLSRYNEPIHMAKMKKKGM